MPAKSLPLAAPTPKGGDAAPAMKGSFAFVNEEANAALSDVEDVKVAKTLTFIVL